MRMLAVADVHSPRFLDPFLRSLEQFSPPDLFLMAGDMINRGRAAEFRVILDAIHDCLGNDFRIVACYGNEEYSEVRNDITAAIGKDMVFLDETMTVIEVDGQKVGIVGTQGSLDKPTNWQRQHLPSVRRTFELRAHRAGSLLKKLRNKVDRRILLMHYSPCLETCEGEDSRTFGWLGSRKFYKLIMSEQPDLVVHGHVHNSVNHEAHIGETLVRNVAIPAVGTLTELSL